MSRFLRRSLYVVVVIVPFRSLRSFSDNADRVYMDCSGFRFVMPKDKNVRGASHQKSRAHPYKSCGKGSKSDKLEESDGRKDWEDALCPICLEFPHNAVLLLCSSHEKGCRPYMCNTSYRHSNCLDQFCMAQIKLKEPQGPIQVILEAESRPRQLLLESRSSGETVGVRIIDSNNSTIAHRLTSRLVNAASPSTSFNGVGSETEETFSDRAVASDATSTRRSRRNIATANATADIQQQNTQGVETVEVEGLEESDQADHSVASSSCMKLDIKGLLCPLCRGNVNGWQVVDAVRKHMNEKSRSCSHESCSFSGTYEELRAHARCQHPFARPSEVNPDRQRDWRRLERQRDIGDVLSSIRAGMPGATVFGDYVIDNEIEMENEDVDFPGDDGQWWTVFMLFQFFGPASSTASSGSLASRVHRTRRRTGRSRLMQLMEGLQNANNEASNAVESNVSQEQTGGASQRRQRRRRRHQGDVS